MHSQVIIVTVTTVMLNTHELVIIVTVTAVMLIMYLLINTVFYNSNSNSVLTSNDSNCNNSNVDHA